MKVKILGTGGAFDPKEGNSSFIITIQDKNYLVDCGEDVFKKLIEQDLVSSIDYICISHLHSDHIGSLSTFIYYSWFVLKKQVWIITTDSIKIDLLTFFRLTGHDREQFEFICSDSVKVYDTTNLHQERISSCSFVFNDKLIITGDIRDDFLNHYYNPILNINNVVIFHDSTNYDCPVHCYYKKLEKNKSPNLYLYHHSENARIEMEEDGYRCLRVGEMEI